VHIHNFNAKAFVYKHSFIAQSQASENIAKLHLTNQQALDQK